MSKSKGTKTAYVPTNAEAISLARQWEERVVGMFSYVALERMRDLADRLEAAEAELTELGTRTQMANAVLNRVANGEFIDEADAMSIRFVIHSLNASTNEQGPEPQCMTTHGTHAESCGELKHYHGKNCSHECPTCGGFPLWDTNHPPESGKA